MIYCLPLSPSNCSPLCTLQPYHTTIVRSSSHIIIITSSWISRLQSSSCSYPRWQQEPSMAALDLSRSLMMTVMRQRMVDVPGHYIHLPDQRQQRKWTCRKLFCYLWSCFLLISWVSNLRHVSSYLSLSYPPSLYTGQKFIPFGSVALDLLLKSTVHHVPVALVV